MGQRFAEFHWISAGKPRRTVPDRSGAPANAVPARVQQPPSKRKRRRLAGRRRPV